MRRLLSELARAVLWLTGTGAAANAGAEVDRAAASLADVEAQLGGVAGPPRRHAA